jgi:23S rRNA pseudouridine1911/1915/1917 synthase
MEHREVIVPENTEPMRVDRFLASALADVSRHYLDDYFDERKVLLDGRPCRNSATVQPGQCIVIRNFVHPTDRHLKPNPNVGAKVIFAHRDFLILNKAAGVPSHANSYDDRETVSNYVLAAYPETRNVGDDPLRPASVHRLDTDTSGLLIVALNQKAFIALQTLFRERRVEKTYLAIIIGKFPFESKTITWPLAHHPKSIQKMVVVSNARDFERLKARDAVTHVHTHARFEGYTLLRVNIETGRMHQIRTHLAYEKFPVSGDPLYRKGGDRAKDHLDSPRQMLHAWKLRFPYGGEDIDVTAPLPSDFKAALSKLGYNHPL